MQSILGHVISYKEQSVLNNFTDIANKIIIDRDMDDILRFTTIKEENEVIIELFNNNHKEELYYFSIDLIINSNGEAYLKVLCRNEFFRFYILTYQVKLYAQIVDIANYKENQSLCKTTEDLNILN